MLSHLQAVASAQGKGEDFPSGDVPPIVWFWEFGDGQRALRQDDRRFGPSPAQRRSGAEQKCQILSSLGFAVDCVGGSKQSAQPNEWGKFSLRRSQKQRIAHSKTKCPNSRAIVECENEVQVVVRL